MKEPKIRLKGFCGEWETKNIASVASLKAGSSIDTSQEISYPSQGYYPCYGGNGLRGYVRDYTHDGIYNIIGRQGALCGNVKMATGKFHATEHAVVVTPTKPLEPYFLFNVLTRANINQYATGVAQPGLSVQNVNKSLYLNIPDFDEQKALGSYFQHLDTLIQSTTKKIESLKQVKAASLHSMFPQEGETTPRVRFRGFEGEWEKVSLSEILEERNEKSPKTSEYPLMAFIAYQGVAPKGERYDRSALINDAETKLYKKTEYGDFIYSSNNLETGSIGLNLYGKATISPVYSIFRCIDNVDYDFIGRRLVCRDVINEMIKWRQGVVYGQWRIHEREFLTINVLLPSYEEQKQIGKYFSSLDSQITLQTQRLEKLKQIKSACLDNMFV